MCAAFASQSEGISAALRRCWPRPPIPRHLITFCVAAPLSAFAFASNPFAFSNRSAGHARSGGRFIFASIQPITGETESPRRGG